MKTCTVCGREWSDDETRCPGDGAPLLESDDGAAGVPNTRRRLEFPIGDEGREDQETVVRARRAVPIPPAEFRKPDVVTGPRAPAPPPRPPAPVVIDERPERSLLPVVIALAVISVAAIGGLFYYMFSEQYSTAASVSSQIADARVAVVEARERIQSLPLDHALRRQILNLDKWDRELQGFEIGTERTPEMAQRAREIEAGARRLSEEARAAGATAPIAPVVPPAVNLNVAPSAPPAAGPGDDPLVPPSPDDKKGPSAPPEEPGTPSPDKRPADRDTNDARPSGPDGPPVKPPVTNVSPDAPVPLPDTKKAPPPPPAGPPGGQSVERPGV